MPSSSGILEMQLRGAPVANALKPPGVVVSFGVDLYQVYCIFGCMLGS